MNKIRNKTILITKLIENNNNNFTFNIIYSIEKNNNITIDTYLGEVK